MTSEELSDFALSLAAKGYHVAPVHVSRDGEGNKVLRFPEGGWKHVATTDPATINSWAWDSATDVVINCGASGLVVSDLDVKRGVDGVVAWSEVSSGWGELNAPTVETPSGGRHLLFRNDDENPTGSSQGLVAPGVDVRGSGGIVVAHEGYADVPGVAKLPPVPAGLVRANFVERQHVTPKGDPRSPRYNDGEEGTRYGLKALASELDRCRHEWDEDEGRFNDQLNRSTYSIGQLVGGGELDRGHAYGEFQDLLSELGGESETKTLDSGFNDGFEHPRSADDKTPATPNEDGMGLISLDDLVSEVDAMPEPQWLIEPFWPSDAYGVLAAERKAGKTWAGLDLAVSVASGHPWQGQFPVAQGPVVYIVGEGGKRNTVRRVRAIARSKGVSLKGLPIHLCLVPIQITKQDHLQMVREWLEEIDPNLVILDPFYLSQGKANGTNLGEMGETLRDIQTIITQRNAAFAIIHHFKKTGEHKGADQLTGVGLQEWARVIGTAAVKSNKVVDEETGRSSVELKWSFVGSEIPEYKFKSTRDVWTDDPKSLKSPMHYEVTIEQDDDSEPTSHNRQTTAADLNKEKIARFMERLESDEWVVTAQVAEVVKRSRQVTAELLEEMAGKGLVEHRTNASKSRRSEWRNARK